MALARIYHKNCCIGQNINTSTDVGGQGDKLSEALLFKVLAELVLLVGVIVEVPYHQGVLLGVDEVLQEMNCPEQGLFL